MTEDHQHRFFLSNGLQVTIAQHEEIDENQRKTYFLFFDKLQEKNLFNSSGHQKSLLKEF